MCCDSFKKNLGGSNDCYSNATSVRQGKGYFRFLPKRKNRSVGRFCCIKIDDCILIKERIQRCDYVFVQCTNSQTYFVELKGQKMQDAYDQVISTIGYFIDKNLCANSELRIGILAIKMSTKANQKLLNLKKDFVRQKWGSKLEATSNYHIGD